MSYWYPQGPYTLPTPNGVCPECGRCNHCGRGGYVYPLHWGTYTDPHITTWTSGYVTTEPNVMSKDHPIQRDRFEPSGQSSEQGSVEEGLDTMWNEWAKGIDKDMD